MIRFENVAKRFADGTQAVQNLDLEIRDGELTVLVGPSGCGKTTTLRMINRLAEASAGQITIDGQSIDAYDITALRRGIGYVMQHAGLFPHRTIFDNVATVPRLLGWPRRQVKERVESLIAMVGLDTSLARRYPHQLSGGQQQRVGVARALAADPPILLMDEPFAAVDPVVRQRLQDELLALQRRLRKTIVFVTHDIDEAIRLGDRIAVFAPGGRLAQYETPAELLTRPADAFVADFLGRERTLKRLALLNVDAAPLMSPAPIVAHAADESTVRATAEAAGTDWVAMTPADAGQAIGWRRVADATVHHFAQTISPEMSLRSALDALLNSPIDALPRVDENGAFLGMISHREVRGALA